MESRTARLAILIDPNQPFEDIREAGDLGSFQGASVDSSMHADNAGGRGLSGWLASNVLRPD